MDTFEKLVAAQEETAKDIEVILRNFRKDPVERKTGKYYEDRLRRLDEAWSKFQSTDNKIRCLSNLPSDHEYFISTYLRVSDLKVKIQDTFKSEMAQLAGNTVSKPAVQPRTERYTDIEGAIGGQAETPKTMQHNAPKQILQHNARIIEEVDETTVKILRNQRALMRALRRNIDEIRAQASEDHPESYYHSKSALIDKYMSDLTLNNDVIWQSTNRDDIDGYNLDDFYRMEAEAHDVISALQQHVTTTNVHQNTIRSEQCQLKLPKIEIPKFSGNYLQWVAFKDLYVQLVHNTGISDVQKMFYLTTHLADEPKGLIKHLAISTENYSIAWNILANRYENKRLIVTALLNNLLSHPNMKIETAQTLKSLHDLTKECINGLKAQGLPVEKWDALMVHILLRKLDNTTQTMFEQSLDDNRRLINLSELLRFMEHRFQALETRGKATEAAGGKDRAKTTAAASSSNNCRVCGSTGHPIFYCEKFLKMSPAERLQWTQKKKLCVNCFKPDHTAKSCTSRSCTKCTSKHNTLLHLETSSKGKNSLSNVTPTEAKQTQMSRNETSSNQPIVAAANKQQNSDDYILLATARVKVIGDNGRIGEFRALLDSGSQVNLVTERLLSKLGLKSTDSSLCIEGIGRKTRKVAHRINFELCAHFGSYSTRVEAFVLANIVSPQPTQMLDTNNWPIPKNINLADPRFNQTDKIDILIGAEFYHQIMRSQQIKINNELPVLQNTTLGWIVTGKIAGCGNQTATCAVFSPDEETTSQLIERFWKLEDTNDSERHMSSLEKRCETHFIQNVKRSTDGRFIVRLPFSENPLILGDSKQMAFNRFLALERRLNNNLQLREDYNKFMKEYEDLGHMEEIQEENIPDSCYVMPHHCVLKPDSSTTKLRVVFDASAKTSSGPSLNEILHAGPTVQSELFSILLRFRMHRFVFTADIEKMYRQIDVNEGDQMYQLIMWRYHKHQDIKFYRLKTVTYGTSAAPYLATKCLQYLATQGLTKYPLGATVLRDDFYVDDCLSGTNSINTALESQRQLQTLLKEAGFKLRKWCSNHAQLLSGIPPEDQEINLDLDESAKRSIKTLGMIWLPKSDQLCGRAQIPPTEKITKRIVSSELARIFDPLGIFGPVVIRAKIFLQQLWQLPVAWDEELSINLQNEWNNFRSNIIALNSLRVDRFVFRPLTLVSTQLHIFVDASERAYGAAVYIRSTYTDKTVATRLLCSKSRVAPIKKQTLPRLELCAAVLGVELTNRVKQDIRLQDAETFFWTDSQIVLAWINSSAGSFYTFVANRIAKIQGSSIPCQWRHVKSKENPADAISRGLSPENLSKHNIWFYGPLFLSGNANQWPEPYLQDETQSCDLEKKNIRSALAVSATPQPLTDMISRINHRNSFNFLQHTIGYILRFTRNTKTTNILRPSHKALDAHELEEALKTIVKAIQVSEFSEELKRLSIQQPVNNSSNLASATPFLDEQQIMRYGGRLEESELSYDKKHPFILPHTHPIVKLLLQMIHENNRHCSAQTLLAASKTRFWITSGKNVTRSIVHNCVRCRRARPRLFKQLMGNLPADRVTPARPFITSGVDYFGPVWIHYKLKGKRADKAYIAVFCCFATKAVHMEVVSNLTTDAFIGALRRFISRRGHCQTLYCDNATNFVGAKNKLAELREAIYSQSAQEKIIRTCSDQSINFKFIPPRAPHFGGLWEAAVKSAKHLLLRSVSAVSLTYEELETVIVEIEAILNSRPLIPLSSNVDDLQALTPGHFLVGEALTTPVDANAKSSNGSLGTHWTATSALKHKFWKDWTQRYLHELQERGKWKTPSPNVAEGMLVILKEDNTPVLKWPLGRITRVYKGDDGLVRVIDVKTATGTFKRSIHRLAPLFSNSNTEYPAYDEPNITLNTQKRQASSDHDNETVIPKRKLVSYSSQGIFSTILISLLLLPLILASPINVTEFKTKPGLYFEGIGSTKVITATWKFIIYYDLTPLWERNKVLENGIISFSKFCNQSSMTESCNSITQYLQHTWDNLIQEEDLLTPNRKRRAALDIVGNVAHALFGVLDSDYADNMSQTIEKVKQNEDYLHRLIKNQTSVIDSTLNIIKEHENNTKTRFSQLKQAIYENLNSIADENSHIKQSQFLMSLAIQLNMLASDLQRVETELITALTHTNHGNISPLILTPQQLKTEITKIKGHIPPGRTLPTEDNDLLELYKIMEIKGAVTKTHIIFVAELPLVDQERFKLFKLIPIPTFINNTMLAIKTNTEFLAINDHRDEYIAITSAQFDKCTTITNEVFLCPHLQVHITRDSGSYICEISLFNNKPSPMCNFAHIHNHLSLTALHQLNHWIYGTTTTMELNAVCGSEITYLNIKHSGILSIAPNCIIKGNSLTIKGHEVSSSTLHTSYAVFGNITAIGKPAEVKRILTPNLDLNIQLEQLTNLHNQLRDNMPAEFNLRPAYETHSGVIALGLTVSAILIIILWRLKIKCKRNSSLNLLQAQPKPAPRQQNISDSITEV